MNSQGAQTVAEGGRLPSGPSAAHHKSHFQPDLFAYISMHLWSFYPPVTWFHRGWRQIKSGALFPGAIRESYKTTTMNHVVHVQY